MSRLQHSSSFDLSFLLCSCCECTCESLWELNDDERDARAFGCTEFACIDPEAPCVDDDFITVDKIEECYDVRCKQAFPKAAERPRVPVAISSVSAAKRLSR